MRSTGSVLEGGELRVRALPTLLIAFRHCSAANHCAEGRKPWKLKNLSDMGSTLPVPPSSKLSVRQFWRHAQSRLHLHCTGLVMGFAHAQRAGPPPTPHPPQPEISVAQFSPFPNHTSFATSFTQMLWLPS